MPTVMVLTFASSIARYSMDCSESKTFSGRPEVSSLFMVMPPTAPGMESLLIFRPLNALASIEPILPPVKIK